MTATAVAAELIAVKTPREGSGAEAAAKRRTSATSRPPCCSSCRPAIGFAVFFVWPALRGIYLSFTNYDLLSAAEMDRVRQLHQAVPGPDASGIR